MNRRLLAGISSPVSFRWEIFPAFFFGKHRCVLAGPCKSALLHGVLSHSYKHDKLLRRVITRGGRHVFCERIEWRQSRGTVINRDVRMGVNLSRGSIVSEPFRSSRSNHGVLRIDFSNLKEVRRESGGARLKWLPCRDDNRANAL